MSNVHLKASKLYFLGTTAVPRRCHVVRRFDIGACAMCLNEQLKGLLQVNCVF